MVKISNENLDKITDTVHNDLIKPVTRNTGNIVNVVFETLSTAIDNCCYKYIENSKFKKKQFLNELEQKYNNIPEQNKCEPNIEIFGPTIDKLKYNISNDELRNLYSNILIADMNTLTKSLVHPAFINVVSELNSNDVRFLNCLYQLENIPAIIPTLENINNPTETYNFQYITCFFKLVGFNCSDYNQQVTFKKSDVAVLENLIRLNLVSFNSSLNYIDQDLYKILEKDALNVFLKNTKELNKDNTYQIVSKNGIITLTTFGKQFLDICLK